MTLLVDITLADWKAFLAYVHRRIRKESGGLWVSLLLAVGVGVVLGVGLTLSPVGRVHFPSILAGAFATYAWLLVVSIHRRRGMDPSADGFILGPREMVVCDDGVREASPRRETFFRWAGIQGVDVTPTHVFLRVDRTAALIVPTRAFESDVARDRFVAEVRARTGK